MRKLDLLLGGILIGIALGFYFLISKLPANATLYPIFVTTLLLLLSLIHVFLTYRKKDDEESKIFKDLELGQLLFVIGSSGLYIFMTSILGYISSTFIYVIGVLFGLKVDKKASLLISIGFSAFIYILFKVLLRVPLPKGFMI